MDKIMLCVDAESARSPEIIGLDGVDLGGPFLAYRMLGRSRGACSRQRGRGYRGGVGRFL